MNIGVLSDGYANAAAQDTFCADTVCTITEIYDQSSNHNNLTLAPPGGEASGSGPGGQDLPAFAAALPVTAGGHKVYGIYFPIRHGLPQRCDYRHCRERAARGRVYGELGDSSQWRMLFRFWQCRDK